MVSAMAHLRRRQSVIVVLLVTPMIVFPGCLYDPGHSHRKEVLAIQAIITINKMQVVYRSQYARYAKSLAELGPPRGGPPNASAADLIGSDLASGGRQEYRFVFTPVPDGYTIHASPVTASRSGRSFYSDQTLVIRENEGPEPTTASSRELK